MQQYVNRVEEFMEALISREAMLEGAGLCRHCNQFLAVWRCKDCVLATPKCRSCIRNIHRENPFHRIERWNGSYYRPAELREVGAYLLVRHCTGDAICDTLSRWTNILDPAETVNDKTEQEELRRICFAPSQSQGQVPGEDTQEYDDRDFDLEGDPDIGESDDEEDDIDDDDELEDDIDAGADPALAASTLGPLRRVVHTNGLHNIHMISCQCHGEDALPLDLFASQLIPASLKRIQTIFTAQVLDQFRLCNLELKASAYQFHQLLRRLTRPMSPAEVPNLYREFRRMVRIWRWMKRLKWAGYAGSSRKVKEVGPGELTIFCPACPQPGINIPDNWREDPAR
jgi:hypothetical protein